MAKPKDKRSARLFALRRKHLRIARRAMRRRRKMLRAGDKVRAGNALRVARYHRKRAQQLLHDRRARRKALRLRLKMKPKNGLAYFGGKQVAAWMVDPLTKARANGWDGRLSSGYRSYASQWIIYYVKRIRPAARPGTSNHERTSFPGGAIDTPSPWQLRAALQRAGRYGAGSPQRLMMFQIPNDPWHASSTGR
jgi:hypothetical protein